MNTCCNHQCDEGRKCPLREQPARCPTLRELLTDITTHFDAFDSAIAAAYRRATQADDVLYWSDERVKLSRMSLAAQALLGRLPTEGETP